MPLGWYLAQGLVPLTASDSDDEEGPCTLPNGRVVCGPHGLVVCGRCCSDYSFMDEVLGLNSEDEDEFDNVGEDEDDDEHYGSHLASEVDAPELPRGLNATSSGAPRRDNDTSFSDISLPFTSPFDALRRGTGLVFPTKFVPPSGSVTPTELFSGRKRHMDVIRYTLPDDTSKVLIRTDGACPNNGQPNPQAGWGFWHGFGASTRNQLTVSGRLERKGPFGDDSLQTSNRAELRAVIAALRFRYWPGEGFRTFVVATDSEYAVEGSTNWARTWVRNGWTTSAGLAVKNRDLWEALLGEIERYKDEGMAVEFWRIPREWNTMADAAARSGAAQEPAPSVWRDVLGMNV